MKVLIGTTRYPGTIEDAVKFSKSLQLHAASKDVKITSGILWTTGDACQNLAFEISGQSPGDLEAFATGVCLALMPSSWCETPSTIPATDEWFGRDLPS